MSLRLQHTLGCALVGFGGLIYLAFRPTTILLFHIADGMGLMPLIAQWRSLMATWQPSEFWVYSFLEGYGLPPISFLSMDSWSVSLPYYA